MAGTGEKLKGMRERLKLGSHHAIERFGIGFMGLSAAMALVLVGTVGSARSNTTAQLDSTPLYTSSFTTSRTETSGEVSNLYVSPDRTRAMVLMKFKDPAKASTSADNYQAYLTGTSPSMSRESLVNEDIMGEIVVFGSTGYLGVVLTSEEPFAQQIMSLTVRANSELVYKKGDPSAKKDLLRDDSFTDHDQWLVFFNPGASEAKVLDPLATTPFDARAIYDQVVIDPMEAEVREKLEDTLGEMQAQLAKIDEYEAQLSRTSVEGLMLVSPRGSDPQEALIPITGDEVIGEHGTTAVSEAQSSEDGAEDAEQSGGAAEVTTGSTLELVTDYWFPGSVDFEWRDGSVGESYFQDLVPADTNPSQWLSDLALEAAGGEQQTGGAARNQLNKSQIDWTLTDGTLLEDSLLPKTSLAPLNTAKTNLETAYGEYWSLKKDYQVKLPMELLELELLLRQASDPTGLSINAADNAVIIY